MLQCQALHVVCLRTLLAKEDVNDDAGILVSSVADTEEGEISFRFRGQELCQHSVAVCTLVSFSGGMVNNYCRMYIS